MYGTIARMRVKPGKLEELERVTRGQGESIDGFAFSHVYQLDSDPQELYLVVGFESREAYRANAGSPEQNARYQEYRALLELDPEWHDGAIVYSEQ